MILEEYISIYLYKLIIYSNIHFLNKNADGLGLFGRETMGCKGIHLHCSKSMQKLIHSTPAWSLMIEQGVFKLTEDSSSNEHMNHVHLDEITIEAIPIVHRAELSDMHAFIIRGPKSSLLFLPDHDSWRDTLAQHECQSIRNFLSKFDVKIALIDGTFWSSNELQGRDMSEVPHPTVQESIERLGLRQINDADIYFTHLNHTNPLNLDDSEEYLTVIKYGWNVCFEGQKFSI